MTVGCDMQDLPQILLDNVEEEGTLGGRLQLVGTLPSEACRWCVAWRVSEVETVTDGSLFLS